MLVNPDFSEVQDTVAAGKYKVRIKKGEVKQWKEDDPTSQYINWELETFGESETKNNGRRIFDKTSVSGKGAFRLQSIYRAATGQVLKGSFDTEVLVGREIQVIIVDGTRNGQPTGYTEVKSHLPVSL